MLNCANCGANDNDSGMFPFYRAGVKKYVCWNCLTGRRGMVPYVCPPK